MRVPAAHFNILALTEMADVAVEAGAARDRLGAFQLAASTLGA